MCAKRDSKENIVVLSGALRLTKQMKDPYIDDVIDYCAPLLKIEIETESDVLQINLI